MSPLERGFRGVFGRKPILFQNTVIKIPFCKSTRYKISFFTHHRPLSRGEAQNFGMIEPSFYWKKTVWQIETLLPHSNNSNLKWAVAPK